MKFIDSNMRSQTGVWEREGSGKVNICSQTVHKDSFGGVWEREDGILLHETDKLNIGMFGFGCVGQGLYDVLNYSQGLKADITKICVKDRGKKRSLGKEYFTFERNEVLKNEGHNLIVELINDSDAAFEIISSALKSGKDVVTANKKTIADNFECLFKLQLLTGSSLLYEGACGGSIPILRTLEEYYDNELLKSIKGIVNGSSNFILTKMDNENLSFHEAAKEAQKLGFAEKDPWLDVAGYDSKYKLCLLAAHGFGIILKPDDVFNLGIQNVSLFDINYAKEKNLKIKLIAHIEKLDYEDKEMSAGLKPETLTRFVTPNLKVGVNKVLERTNGTKEKYRTFVMPFFISDNEQLARVNYEFNGIEIEGVFSDKQFFSGKGAGSHPTGSAVLSDISAITYDYRYGYKKLKKRVNGTVPDFGKDSKFLDNEFPIKVYIRYKDKEELDKLEIDSVEEEYSSSKGNFVVANVNFRSLMNIQDRNELFVCSI